MGSQQAPAALGAAHWLWVLWAQQNLPPAPPPNEVPLAALSHMVGCLPSPTKRDFCFKHFSIKTASDNTGILKTLSSILQEVRLNSAWFYSNVFPPSSPRSEKLIILTKHTLVFPVFHTASFSHFKSQITSGMSPTMFSSMTFTKQSLRGKDLGTCDVRGRLQVVQLLEMPSAPPAFLQLACGKTNA